MTRKLLMLLLGTLLLFVAACGKSDNGGSGSQSGGSGSQNQNAGSSAQKNEPAAKLSIAYYITGAHPTDLEEVQNEINNITREKINAEVTLVPIAGGDYPQKSNLMLVGNEKLDLLITGTRFDFATKAASGQLLPLDDLIEQYGSGIAEVLGPELLRAGSVGGQVYAIPTMRDMAGANAIYMRKDLVDKYQIDVSSIKTWDDVGNVLRLVKQKEPGMYPLVPYGPVPQTTVTQWFDSLSDKFGVLPMNGDGKTIVNLFESQEYADFVNRMRQWYEEGLVLPDYATTSETRANLIRSGLGFAFLAPDKPGGVEQESKSAGMEIVGAAIDDPLTTTFNAQNIMWAIPRNSQHPEKAMQLLNLMYTDANLVNLLNWGIEGKHYVKVGDNVVKYPDGLDANTVGFNQASAGFQFGNQFLSYVLEGEDPEMWKKLDEFAKKAQKSPALGFTFDNSSVKSEVAAVNAVYSQYGRGLEGGSLDPAEALPAMISEMKAAGLDKIIAEKQRQFDEFLKTKN